MRNFLFTLGLFVLFHCTTSVNSQSVIRINQLGYLPESSKVAVWGSKQSDTLLTFALKDSSTGKIVFTGTSGVAFGAYGPFLQTYRLQFSQFTTPGVYQLVAGKAVSPYFHINNTVYKGAADFCLRYLRQQRSGFNPFLKDSCHQFDGYKLFDPIGDSGKIDASGGWHDASDYLQYVTTSANATYQLLAAWRDFPEVFTDNYLANGLTGNNQLPDIVDEATWGLQWLLKMHPSDNEMYHQLADDRDHISMRRPALDAQYGKGYQRPVYFVTGRPQGSIKHLNRSTGAANIAGKFSTAFALGTQLLNDIDRPLANKLRKKAFSAYAWGKKMPGVCQTAPNRAPYFYEEDNWSDDMELAAAQLANLTHKNQYKKDAKKFAALEPVTPWMGADTARHYQWYPFANAGHFEMAMMATSNSVKNNMYSQYMQQGLQKVWQKSKSNAFLRGVPFIWCSNNLTVALANQCYWYQKTTGDSQFAELGQAAIDWLFGCNPWGTSMVYGLPKNGDTPTDPHSWFTHTLRQPIDGGLVDGPVYTSIYNNLIGIALTKPDSYSPWQSNLAVYHDDYGDYSTNEPTMDGTASLIYLLAAQEATSLKSQPSHFTKVSGAIIRGDSTKPQLALVFTAHDYTEGWSFIQKILKKEKVPAAFFLTGDCVRNNPSMVVALKKDNHYIGPHSNKHLLYASWQNRQQLLVTQDSFNNDLQTNYDALATVGITKKDAPMFLSPYEWYNDSIANWAAAMGITLINHTPGTLSAADYTTPQENNYRNSNEIYNSILAKASNNGLNGFLLLLHAGTDPKRTDKMYHLLPQLLPSLRKAGYQFVAISQLFKDKKFPINH